ncbi:MAG: TIGR03767 family metallophosphoesterase [Acidimicrobiales bacterium]
MTMSRRAFIRRVGAAAGTAVPLWALAAACAGDQSSSPPGTNGAGGTTPGSLRTGADLRTTLEATIALAAGTGYRALQWGAGEPFLTRDDLGVSPGADRAKQRRSVLYFGQLSDTHVVDAQTPSRADWTFDLIKNSSAFRAQETLTVHVLAEMVKAVNALNRSVVTGAPCAVSVVTGDLTDSKATTELGWYLDVLAGGSITANSGTPGTYEGVQAWPEATYAYHPDDPSKDFWGQNGGYPAIPGLLDAAVSRSVESPGLAMPWLSVIGNHDDVWMGTLGPYTKPYDDFAIGSNKIAVPPPDSSTLLGAATKPDDPAAQAQLQSFVDTLGSQPGVKTVAADPKRKGFTAQEIVNAHFDVRSRSGPVGHGFTEASRTTGEAWWTWQVGPAVRFIALDTNNHYFGADGSLPQNQWEWLEQQLIAHSSTYLDPSGQVVTTNAKDQLIVLLSHHTSWTMDNTAAASGDTTKLYTGPELVELLLRFPNVVAWVNGHTHANTIKPHKATSTMLGGGFWEINTPSCIDWAQQSRMIEIVDNRDGTLSLFTLTVDHEGDPQTAKGDFGQTNMASLSRELAANAWFWDCAALLGTPQDRNTELLIKAPFDLSKVADAQLEDHALTVSLREQGAGRPLVAAPA